MLWPLAFLEFLRRKINILCRHNFSLFPIDDMEFRKYLEIIVLREWVCQADTFMLPARIRTRDIRSNHHTKEAVLYIYVTSMSQADYRFGHFTKFLGRSFQALRWVRLTFYGVHFDGLIHPL